MATITMKAPTTSSPGHNLGTEMVDGFRSAGKETTKALSQTLEYSSILGKSAINVTSRMGHALASILTAPINLTRSAAKGIKQSGHATLKHGITGSIKNAKSKKNRERFLSGITLGGYNVGKAGLNMAKRVPEAALSGFSPAYHNISDAVTRKKDYTIGKKKGFIHRAEDNIKQIPKHTSYEQPADLLKVA